MITKTLFSLSSEHSHKILCFYANTTSQVQIVRIGNIANWNFERVIFPGERLLFEPLPEGELEVYTSLMKEEILLEKIPCLRLQVNEPANIFKAVAQSDYSYICL